MPIKMTTEEFIERCQGKELHIADVCIMNHRCSGREGPSWWLLEDMPPFEDDILYVPRPGGCFWVLATSFKHPTRDG